MKKQVIKGLKVGVGLLASCLYVEAIGIRTVNMAQVFDGYSKVKDDQKSFEVLVGQAQKEEAAKNEEAKRLFDERQTLIGKLNNPSISPEAKEKLKQDLQEISAKIEAKGAEIIHFRQDQEGKLERQRQAILAERYNEIEAVIRKIVEDTNKGAKDAKAEKEKIDVVLNAAGGAVLYANKELDLTQKVLEALNKTAAKSSEKNKGTEAAKVQKGK